ncbi:ATP-binding protein [Herbaspirillum sp. YR522]|uniref:ATP-binding response regulator n=1 Tax=Herbaspirillum sp. YR522 TaxID=1144342 RepID=UPI00026F8884|nr:ATP-binding protein [Herbaspirillum sp. YR522]EJN00826.1 signal transduction histidine kinase [Herbaspirillum sp. YR522]
MADNADGRRVLICTPFGKDARLAAHVLEKAGLNCVICKDLAEVLTQLQRGAGALLTADDVVAPNRSAALSDFIARQPPWSDLPVLVLTRIANDGRWYSDAHDRLRNLTLLESPVRPSTLVSTVRAAVRARERQYEVHEADRRKDEFLAMLGHELRNPLAPIGAAAQLLALASADVGKVKMASQIIARQVKHMTSLIDDLLDVARVTRGLITLDRELIDIRQVLGEAVEQVDSMMRSRGHTLTLDMPASQINVQGDHKRLVQVFANVLHNAAKYTPNGGAISAAMTVQGSEVVVEVTDDGIGMNPDVVAHVFELFAQAERSADRSQGGLGLGLSLVESLVRSHGGSVQAVSAGIGQGSRFTIRLPHMVSLAADQVAAAHAGAAAQAPASKRIMIVDDNQDAADALAMVLQVAGYEVSAKYTAGDAIGYARQHAPAICLLDIGLPDMDGNELARALRQLPQTAGALLVAVTGYGQQEDKEKSRAAGFDHHLVKPIDVDRLVDLLARS